MTPRVRGLVLAASLGAVACHAPKRGPQPPRGAFGILFGGQVQERRAIPFELDETKQTLGFVVEWSAPLGSPIVVSWNLVKPKPKPRAASRRRHARAENPEPKPVAGEATARPGETRFEHVVHLEPGDPLGTWSVRVTAGSDTVVDRSFELYDAADRGPEPLDGG